MNRVRCHVARVGDKDNWGIWLWGPGICAGVPRADGTVAPPRRRVRADGSNPLLLHSVRGDRTPPLWMGPVVHAIDGRLTHDEAREYFASVLAYGTRRLSQQARRAREAA